MTQYDLGSRKYQQLLSQGVLNSLVMETPYLIILQLKSFIRSPIEEAISIIRYQAGCFTSPADCDDLAYYTTIKKALLDATIEYMEPGA